MSLSRFDFFSFGTILFTNSDMHFAIDTIVKN